MAIFIEMIKILKSKIPRSFKKIIRSIYPLNVSSEHTYFFPKDSKLNISDFFMFRCDDYETVFIAENNLALLMAKPIDCKHAFYFFNSHGQLCGKYKDVSNSFHYALKITNQMTNNEKIGSFIHQTSYPSDVIIEDSILTSNKIYFQHRGYTGFRKKNGVNSCYSYMHGNFGGMYLYNDSFVSLSRQRVSHFYTPQIVIKPDRFYELYFCNPTDKKLVISISLIDKSLTSYEALSKVIKPKGSYLYKLDTFIDNQITNISWKTNLPVGRAAVFENNGLLFDVFHS
jgi:hypothetical protein